MTWQGAGTPGGGQDPQPEDEATRADWPVPAAEPPAAPAADTGAAAPPPGPPPAAPGPAAFPPPATPPAAPVGAPSASDPMAPVAPWGAPQPGDAWAAGPTGGGQYSVPGAPGLVYAGAVPRLAAWLVDGILLAIVAGIISAPFAPRLTTAELGDPSQLNDLSQLVARSPVGSIISLVLGAAYFVFFWSTAGRGTPGMRLFKIQIGDAATGNRIDYATGFRRWLAFATWLGLLALVPGVIGLSGIAEGIWSLVLLFTTVSSPTKQGLHDRFAGTALVRPASAGNGLAWGCLLVFLLLPIVAVLLLLPLIYLGGQVSDILSTVGSSI